MVSHGVTHQHVAGENKIPTQSAASHGSTSDYTGFLTGIIIVIVYGGVRSKWHLPFFPSIVTS